MIMFRLASRLTPLLACSFSMPQYFSCTLLVPRAQEKYWGMAREDPLAKPGSSTLCAALFRPAQSCILVDQLSWPVSREQLDNAPCGTRQRPYSKGTSGSTPHCAVRLGSSGMLARLPLRTLTDWPFRPPAFAPVFPMAWKRYYLTKESTKLDVTLASVR